MTLPLASNIEIPILHELFAVGGTENVRYLYIRLFPYFPSLSDAEISTIKTGGLKNWKKAIQKAGKQLVEDNLIVRKNGIWKLTIKGNKTIKAESEGIIFTQTEPEIDSLSHTKIQTMLVKIGQCLGFFAETEFQFYDVVWRETTQNERLSHVFEVQSKGNLDSAFAKLKRAHDAQRSKIFLVISTERDTKRASNSLNREFREIEKVLTILSFVEIRKIHENLCSIDEFLPKFIHT